MVVFCDNIECFFRLTRSIVSLLYVESIEGPYLAVYSISFSIFGLLAVNLIYFIQFHQQLTSLNSN